MTAAVMSPTRNASFSINSPHPADVLSSMNDCSTAPEDIDFAAIKELMTAKYTVELVDRHVAAIRKVAKTCCNGFLLKHLEPLVDLLQLAIERFAQGHLEFSTAICEFTRVSSQPMVSCKASDMITYGHHLPAFIKVLVSVLEHTLPPSEDSTPPADDVDARAAFEDKRAICERIRIEVAHTLACWSRFGLDEESVEPRPDEPLIQAVADAGTPNLRILKHSQVMDALSASFRAENSPEAIVITLGAIRDMSLYRPLARQITNCGLISNLVHVIRVNLLGSDVLLVAAEVLWNVLELDWEGAAEALGQTDVIDSFRDFMEAVLTKGYRFKDKIFRNDIMVLLMYIAKRPENRPLFASTGLVALLLSQAISEGRRKELQDTGTLSKLIGRSSDLMLASKEAKLTFVTLTNSQEDMEFRMLLWGTLAKCCSSDECAQVAIQCGLVPSLLAHLDTGDLPQDQRQWSQEQRRKGQLEALSALFQLVQYVPHDFIAAQGNDIVLRLLQATRSREVQKKCLNLLQVAVRISPQFREELGQLGAVGVLVDMFTDRDNPMGSRQLCASVLAGLCSDNPDNCREFRKKDGVEAIREEVMYRPDETTDNHLYFSLSVVDCIWCAIVGTRKNEVRFLDAGGLFALLDVLEIAPMLLKRQIMGCLADLMLYKKAAKLFAQWNSQVTMKGALKILLELWHNEQQAAGGTDQDGVIRDPDRPLNPARPPAEDEEEAMSPTQQKSFRASRSAAKFQHARTFADATARSSPKKAGRTCDTFGGASPKRAGRTAENFARDASPKNSASGQTSVSLPAVINAHQDCRAKIYSVLRRVDFECHETLSVGERQQMELVKLYPDAIELETWIKVQECLDTQGIKPVAADRKWMEEAIAERRDQSLTVMESQRQLADERRRDEEAGLRRFYDDIRGRAQFRRVTSAKEAMRAVGGGADGGYPTRGSVSFPARGSGVSFNHNAAAQKARNQNSASSGDESS